MNLLFNLVHISDLNLFKEAVNELSKCNKVYVTVRERGNLLTIAEKELNFPIIIIGRHQQGLFRKLVGIIYSEIAYWKLLRKLNIDVSINQSFYSVWACKLRGAKFITFEDDYEYKMAFYYAKWLASKDVMPKFIPAKGKNVVKYNGFKELAYLHPNRFSPNPSALVYYNLKPYDYIFVRDVANISLNYRDKKDYLQLIISKLTLRNFKIILSSENKDKLKCLEASPQLIILNEPVNDIFSLIKYSIFSISSGDTVARESALLSTPCIYTGSRNMIMNKPLIDLGMIFQLKDINDLDIIIDSILLALGSNNNRKEVQLNKYADTTQVIINEINNLEKEMS